MTLNRSRGFRAPLHRALHTLARIICIATIASLFAGTLSVPIRAQVVQTVPMGVNLEFVNDYQTSLMFVDVMHAGRPFNPINNVGGSGGAPVDSNGWPTTDAATVLFDGATYIDYSGTYHLLFVGQATITPSSGTLANQTYTAATNLTTADITLTPTDHNLTLYLTNTKRTAASATNTGLTNLKCIRPGYPANTTQTFTTNFINSLAPFSVLRFMDSLDTNATNSLSTPPYHTLDDTNWADRRHLTDASQSFTISKPRTHGLSWEYVIQLCNETGRDAWINVPISATDDYVTQLAALFKNTLNPSLHVYVENSNEVWNYGFPQYGYNIDRAVSEVNAGGSNLNYDNINNNGYWATRRVAKRIYEISTLFKAVYGGAAINTTVRPVLAYQAAQPSVNRDQLTYLEANYGGPKKYLYAIAGAPYYATTNFSSVSAILAGMTARSNANVNDYTLPARAESLSYGLKNFAYEGGTDGQGANTQQETNNVFAAFKDPGMTTLVKHDLQDNWFATGSDLYVYYNLSGTFWGLVDTTQNLNAPRYNAVTQVVTEPAPTVTAGAALPATGQTLTLHGTPDSLYPTAAVGTMYLNQFGSEAIYLIRNTTGSAANYTVKVNTMGAPAGDVVEVAVDGQRIQTIGTTAPPAVPVTIGPGQHALRVRLLSPYANEFSYDPITIVGTGATVKGALSGSVASASGVINLSGTGLTDWAHWGYEAAPAYDHKATGGSKISNFTLLGSGTVYGYGDDAVGFSWTGGTPAASAINTTSGLYISGVNNGFRFTVPADTTTRTLKVYVGGWLAQGTLTVQLSDGSAANAANYVATASSATSSFDKVFTMTYNAASAGRTLTVSWKLTADYNGGYGNITLQSAVLP